MSDRPAPESSDKTDPVSAADGKLQGEGDYRSARKFQKEQHEFASDDERVDRRAQEARDALDGPEGEELEKARKDTAAGRTS